MLQSRQLAAIDGLQGEGQQPTATSMRSLATSSILRITFFSILTSWDSFLARSGPKAPPAFPRRAWPALSVSQHDHRGFAAQTALKCGPESMIRSCQAILGHSTVVELFAALTQASLSKKAAGLGGRRRRRRALFIACVSRDVKQRAVADNGKVLVDPYLELRRRWRAGLAHRVCSMHFGGVAER